MWERASGTTEQWAVREAVGRAVDRPLPFPLLIRKLLLLWGTGGRALLSQGAPHPILCPGEWEGAGAVRPRMALCCTREAQIDRKSRRRGHWGPIPAAYLLPAILLWVDWSFLEVCFGSF